MNRIILLIIVALALAGGAGEIRGQSTEVPLSSFSGGFGEQGVSGKGVIAQVGNAAVGRSSGSGKVVLSGFIPGAVKFRLGSTVEYPVRDKWNMVSVPLTLAEYAKASVYPSAVSNAFFFNGAYTAAPVLANGPGYWVKFDGDQNVALTGHARDVDSFAVTQGWNMVGSISSPVNTSDITSNPPGILVSNFFRFDNMYVPATTIEPGRAYWVKTTVSGRLILNAAGAAPAAGRIRIEDHGEMPPPPPGDELADAVPTEFALAQNYPNPFNPSTTIRYELPSAGVVRVTVYDALGRVVGKLADGVEEAGYHAVEWNSGNIASGVYFYRIDVVDPANAGVVFTSVKKMLLMR